MDAAPKKLAVMMPIYEDWESAVVVVDRVHSTLAAAGYSVDFLLVNDGGITPAPASLTLTSAERPPSIEVLHLRRNLGHQRAIAIGLSHLQTIATARAVVVMDGDGEDTPDGVLRLVRHLELTGGRSIVFGARARRTESFTFRFLYFWFRMFHRVLTGRHVRVGNFSVVPAELLNRLVAVSELWNHYAAAVFKARLPTDSIPIDRGYRVAGQSQMNFVSLVVHGLSAVSVFGDVLGPRLLVATFVVALGAVLGIVGAIGIRFFTDIAIPGWATTAIGLFFLILLQAFLMLTVFVFITLQGRSAIGFLPVRDHVYFIDRKDAIPVKRPGD